MSTKIYNGIKFTTNDLIKIKEILLDIREELKPKAVEKLSRSICFSWSRKFDSGEENFDAYWGAQSEIYKKAKDLKAFRPNDSIDCDFQVTLFPHKKEIYGMYFCIERQWCNIFLNNPFVEDFYYFDNADMPDHLTEEEWLSRGEIWDEVLGYSAPSEKGFTFEILDTEMLLIKDMPIRCSKEYLPSKEERVEHLILEEMTNAREDKNAFKAYNYIKKSEEGKKEFKRRMEEILPTIKDIPDISGKK